MQALDRETIKALLPYLGKVFFPLVVAVLFYLVFRPVPPDFLLGLSRIVDGNLLASLRASTTHFPRFVADSLVDGLWAFAFMNFMLLTTRTDRTSVKFGYIFVSIVLMLGFEVGQLYFVDGTYDQYDLAAISIGIFTSCCLWAVKEKP